MFFDFTMTLSTGVFIRKYTATSGLPNGVSGPITITTGALLNDKFTVSGLGTVRCGYSAVSQPGATGWNGFVVTEFPQIPGSIPVYESGGNGTPGTANAKRTSWWIRPFVLTDDWPGNQQIGWAFEVGVLAGNVANSMVANWPSGGCPVGLGWSTAAYTAPTTYRRGRSFQTTNTNGSLTYYRGQVGGNTGISLSSILEYHQRNPEQAFSATVT